MVLNKYYFGSLYYALSVVVCMLHTKQKCRQNAGYESNSPKLIIHSIPSKRTVPVDFFCSSSSINSHCNLGATLFSLAGLLWLANIVFFGKTVRKPLHFGFQLALEIWSTLAENRAASLALFKLALVAAFIIPELDSPSIALFLCFRRTPCVRTGSAEGQGGRYWQ